MSNPNLVNHVYKFFEAAIRERDANIPILASFPDVKTIPEKVFVIEYTGAEPRSVADGSIDLEMRWEIRFIKLIKDQEKTRHDVQEMSWKLGALFHHAIIPDPINSASGEPGFPCYFMGTSDDNFDYEQKSYESWVTEIAVESRIGRSFFEEI